MSGLPFTQKKHDSIWVIIDRLTKSTHFIPVRIDYSMDQLAKLYVDEIVRLHGVPWFICVRPCDTPNPGGPLTTRQPAEYS